MASSTPMDKRILLTMVLTAVGWLPDQSAHAASCETSLTDIEQTMQDGLAALTKAHNLQDEGMWELDRDEGSNQTGCAFLSSSRESAGMAQTYFQTCTQTIDAALERCPDMDWDTLSASPALCETRLEEIEGLLSVLDTARQELCSN